MRRDARVEMRFETTGRKQVIIRTLFAVLAPLYGMLSDTYSRARAMQLLGLTFTLIVGVSLRLFFRAMSADSSHERS